MQFQKDFRDHPFYIQSYNQETPEIIIVKSTNNEKILINNNVLITFDELIINWRPQNIHDLNSQDITEILNYKPEIVLIGTGKTLVQLDYAILAPLFKTKIPFELMTTINACRTYNLLASEHRKVLAGLTLM